MNDAEKRMLLMKKQIKKHRDGEPFMIYLLVGLASLYTGWLWSNILTCLSAVMLVCSYFSSYCRRTKEIVVLYFILFVGSSFLKYRLL